MWHLGVCTLLQYGIDGCATAGHLCTLCAMGTAATVWASALYVTVSVWYHIQGACIRTRARMSHRCAPLSAVRALCTLCTKAREARRDFFEHFPDIGKRLAGGGHFLAGYWKMAGWLWAEAERAVSATRKRCQRRPMWSRTQRRIPERGTS